MLQTQQSAVQGSASKWGFETEPRYYTVPINPLLLSWLMVSNHGPWYPKAYRPRSGHSHARHGFKP